MNPEPLDVHESLSGRRFERREAPGDELLLAEDVARLLRVSTAWVYAETRANRLPHLRLGRYVRFRRDALEQWMRSEEERIGRARHG